MTAATHREADTDAEGQSRITLDHKVHPAPTIGFLSFYSQAWYMPEPVSFSTRDSSVSPWRSVHSRFSGSRS
jgi:hypothetical protein